MEPTNPKDIVGQTKAPVHLVPAALVVGVSEAMADGAKKYGPYNWREQKVLYTVYLGALERHLLALKDGEDIDPKTGVHHAKSIGANVAIILDAMYLDCLYDDRPPKGPAPAMLEALVKREPSE